MHNSVSEQKTEGKTVKTFTTSFGKNIPCISGYQEAHIHARKSDTTPPPEGYEGMTPFGIDGFIKDAYEYSIVIDFLDSLGVKKRWDRALDIGGAEGTVSRFLRGEGRAGWAANLELADFGKRLSTGRFLKHWIRYKTACDVARFSPRMKRFLVGEDTWGGKRLTRTFAVFGYMPPPGSIFWNMRLRAVPAIDKFLVQDLYTVENQKFDLITSICSMPCFDAERKIAKVSELLPDGGMFVFLSDNWWFPVNSSLVIGKFPYVSQRLNPQDFKRYIEEFHPDDAEDWLGRYNYFHFGKQRPTLDDYIRMADRYDMELIGSRRLYPPHLTHFRAAMTPRLLNQFEETRLSGILEDVRKFRPDVGMSDLMSNYHMAAFIKRARRKETATQYLAGLQKNGTPSK